MTQQLTLYYFPSCPFCQRVLKYLKDHNIQIILKDIHASSAYKNELMSVGGKAQVPCLVIDGKALYESADIIQWLDKNYS